MSVSCQVNTENLMAAVALLRKNSRSKPAESLNRTVQFIVRDAQQNTPATGLATIDSDLKVMVTPVIGKRGRPLSMRAAKNRVYSANGVGSGGEPFPEVPLLWLLISARAKAGSKYNLSTDSHWAIGGGHPFKGRRVSEFASISESFESRMVKSRHSSANFMKSSWSEILKVLGATYSLPAAAGLSQAIPARPGSLEVSCRIDNLMGMSGRYSNLDDKRNAAAKRVLLPVLQRAIDREFEGKMREAARRGLLEDVGLLRSLGVVVS